ncbi:SLC22A6 [Symbiodinium sp. KB8]|nr:SLC22A6 [Symbiodinium sp. KB8]
MAGGVDQENRPRPGIYVGKKADYSCPGDHVTWEIVLMVDGACSIECRSELSPSKGGTQAWHVEGTWEWVEDDDEVVVTVTKEDPLGGPRRDRDLELSVSDDQTTLTFKGAACSWTAPPPDPWMEEMATLSLKDLKARAVAFGLDPTGCVEREEFLNLLQRGKASGALKEVASPKAASPSPPDASPASSSSARKEPEKSEKTSVASPSPAAGASPVASAGYAGSDAPTPVADAETQEIPEGCFSLEQLTDKRVWEKLDVVSTERETYLPEPIFQKLFGMPKADFAKLPKWKKELQFLIGIIALLCPPAGAESCAASTSGPMMLQARRSQLNKSKSTEAVMATMGLWTKDVSALRGGSCEYAAVSQGGLQSPAATSKYLESRAVCIANPEIYGNGAACGSCWKAHREGQGSMVVQIIGSHGGSDLGCFFDAFRTISGADSGTFEVSLEPVQCEVADAGPVATILDGNNAWYTRAIFSNLPYAVVKASILVDGKATEMQRVSGATWQATMLRFVVQGNGILRRLLQFLACRDGKFLHRLKLPNSQPNTGTDYDEPDLCSSHSDNPEGHHPSSDRNHAAILSLRGPW